VRASSLTHERLAQERVVVELAAQRSKRRFGGRIGPVGSSHLQPVARAAFFEAHGPFRVRVRAPARVVVSRQVLFTNQQQWSFRLAARSEDRKKERKGHYFTRKSGKRKRLEEEKDTKKSFGKHPTKTSITHTLAVHDICLQVLPPQMGSSSPRSSQGA